MILVGDFYIKGGVSDVVM